MSHADFDVVSGPAVAGLRILPPAILGTDTAAPVGNGQAVQTVSVAGSTLSGSVTPGRPMRATGSAI
jgi:hypothetical protein